VPVIDNRIWGADRLNLEKRQLSSTTTPLHAILTYLTCVFVGPGGT